jgi:S1-C subfamily serine protease
VVVAAIPIEFAALNPGLNPGDVIYEMNSSKIRTLGELRDALSGIKPGSPVALLVEHDGTLGYVAFSLE